MIKRTFEWNEQGLLIGSVEYEDGIERSRWTYEYPTGWDIIITEYRNGRKKRSRQTSSFDQSGRLVETITIEEPDVNQNLPRGGFF